MHSIIILLINFFPISPSVASLIPIASLISSPPSFFITLFIFFKRFLIFFLIAPLITPLILFLTSLITPLILPFASLIILFS